MYQSVPPVPLSRGTAQKKAVIANGPQGDYLIDYFVAIVIVPPFLNKSCDTK